MIRAKPLKIMAFQPTSSRRSDCLLRIECTSCSATFSLQEQIHTHRYKAIQAAFSGVFDCRLESFRVAATCRKAGASSSCIGMQERPRYAASMIAAEHADAYRAENARALQMSRACTARCGLSTCRIVPRDRAFRIAKRKASPHHAPFYGIAWTKIGADPLPVDTEEDATRVTRRRYWPSRPMVPAAAASLPAAVRSRPGRASARRPCARRGAGG